MAIVLVGDVGGTNSRLQLFRVEKEESGKITSTLLDEKKLSSHDYVTFRDLVAFFLSSNPHPILAAIGIAGPVSENRCKITNVHWPEIIGEELAQAFHMRECRLMNDFEAAGYGVLDLKPSDMVNINEVGEIEGRPKAVIGAGTGIGECILTAHNGEYVVWPGEGGHCDFFPKTPTEFAYSQYIMAEVNKEDSPYKHFRPIDNITVELAIGGIVLHHLYYFFRQQNPQLVNAEFDAMFEARRTTEKAALLFEYGLTGRDQICQLGVRQFLTILGYEAGNMATKTLCYGGLYLMGGVLQKNLESIQRDGTLYSSFYKKPAHITKILKQVPVYLVMYEDVGLLGALYYAKKMLTGSS